MNYYLVHKDYDENSEVICSSNEKLEKGDVVVIPIGYRVTVAIVAKELDVYEAMSRAYNRIREIVDVVEMTEFKKKLENEMMASQIEEIMEEKVDELKRIDSYRRIADKNPEFKELFDKYQSLKKSSSTPNLY